jgi:hypothetical protein
VIALTTLALGTVAARGGARAQQALVLAALSLGMPHGAADTELLRSAAGGDRRRHAGLLLGYAATGAAATAVVHRGGRGTEAAVLLASAAHFAEGELACWPASGSRRRSALRLLAAVLTTVAVPAAIGTANRRPAAVGATAAVPADATPRAVGDRSGLALLRAGEAGRAVPPLLAAAVAAVVALAADRDVEGAGDTALLLALPVLGPPAPAVRGLLRRLARAAPHRPGHGRAGRGRPAAGAALAARRRRDARPSQRLGGRRGARRRSRAGGARPAARQRQRVLGRPRAHRPAHGDGGLGARPAAVALQVAAALLLALDRLEQRLEVADAEARASRAAR